MTDYSVSHTGQHLIVSAPGSSLFSWFLVISIPLIALILLFMLRSQDKKAMELNAQYPNGIKIDIAKRRTLFYSIAGPSLVALAAIFWAVGYTSASLVMDKPTNTAIMHVKMTAFVPSQEQTIPLSSVTGAVLDYKPNARRIRLTTNSGEDLAFPMWTSRGGQKEAVDAINAFVSASHH